MPSNQRIIQVHTSKGHEHDRQTDLTLSTTKKKRISRSRGLNNQESTSSSKQRYLNRNKISHFNIDEIIKSQYRKNKQKQYRKPEKQNNREPTPCKSRKLISFESETIKRNQIDKIRDFQKQLEINDLNQQISQSKRKQNRLRNQINLLENQNKNLSGLVAELKHQIRQQKIEHSKAKNKINQLQKNILETQTNLQSAHKNFEKLQKQIKVNQVANMKVMINKLQNENNGLKTKNQQITQKQIKLEQSLKNLKDQIATLNNILNTSTIRQNYLQNQLQISLNKLQESKTSVQHQLQNRIQKLILEKQILLDSNDRLHIQLDFNRRKSVQEYRLCIKKKNQMIVQMKNKNQKLRNQNENLKNKIKQIAPHLLNTQNVSSSKTGKTRNATKHEVRNIRQSIMTSDHKRGPTKFQTFRQEQIQLQLSPQ